MKCHCFEATLFSAFFFLIPARGEVFAIYAQGYSCCFGRKICTRHMTFQRVLFFRENTSKSFYRKEAVLILRVNRNIYIQSAHERSRPVSLGNLCDFQRENETAIATKFIAKCVPGIGMRASMPIASTKIIRPSRSLERAFRDFSVARFGCQRNKGSAEDRGEIKQSEPIWLVG